MIDDNILELYRQAQLCIHNNEYIKGINIYESLLAIADDRLIVDIYFNLADLYGEMDRYDLAFQAYEDILSIDEENSGAWYGLGYTGDILGWDPMDSIDCYDTAIYYNKNYKEAYYYCGILLADIGELEESVIYLTNAVELDLDDFVAINDLASIYEELGEYEKGLELVKRSIEIRSDYYKSWYNLGVLLERLGNDSEAMEAYVQASTLGDDPIVYLNISALFIEKKAYDKAIEYLTTGIDKCPSHILYYNRACCYALTGDVKKAKSDLMAGAKIDSVVYSWAKDDPDFKEMKGVL